MICMQYLIFRKSRYSRSLIAIYCNSVFKYDVSLYFASPFRSCKHHQVINILRSSRSILPGVVRGKVTGGHSPLHNKSGSERKDKARA